MSNYRRAYVPGGTVFLTIVTCHRERTFAEQANVVNLRLALRQVMQEVPFRIPAAVVLPDHLHFLWSLPRGDSNYSRRVGRMKVLFTRTLQDRGVLPADVSRSRHKHRESDVWNRRFWEHTVGGEGEFERLLDYIHYNPVKHGLVSCPHLWPFSSFRRWSRSGLYPEHWGCRCGGRTPDLPGIDWFGEMAGE